MAFSIGVFTRFASNITMFDSSNVTPITVVAHLPAKSIANVVMTANSTISVVKSLFTRIVYTNGVLNFSFHASYSANPVTAYANPIPR